MYEMQREIAVVPIDHHSVTGTVFTLPDPPTRKYTQGDRGAVNEVPAEAMLFAVHVVRTTAWNQAATLLVGKTGTTGWLVDTGEVTLNAAIPAGEDGDVTSFAVNKLINDTQPILATWNQAAATAGAGYLVFEYGRF